MTTQSHLPLPQALRLMMLPSPSSDPTTKHSAFKPMAPFTATMTSEGKELMKEEDLFHDKDEEEEEEEEEQGWMSAIVRKSYMDGTDVHSASAPASLSSCTGDEEEWSEDDDEDSEFEFEDYEHDFYMDVQVGRSAPVPIPGAGKGRSRKLEDSYEDDDFMALMLGAPSVMYRTDFAGNRCTQAGVWLTPEGYVLPGKPEQVRCAQQRHSKRIVDF